MRTLYPSAVQFHCGLITGAALVVCGVMLWLVQWEYAAAAGTVALGAAVASAIITVREG